MIRIGQVKIPFQGKYDISEEQLLRKAARILEISVNEIAEIEIVKFSIDARKKPELFLVYTLDLLLTGEEKKKNGFGSKRENTILKKCKSKNASIAKEVSYEFPAKIELPEAAERPIIVGMGPAGLFCAYLLAKDGYKPILLERGADVDTRSEDVEKFWLGKEELKEESNVQFGEGGAGTFSDGKLNTLVKDKDGRNKFVLRTFVKHGAPERILYDSKPHIGTDILKHVVKSMREQIIAWGGEVRFHQKVTDILVEQSKIKGVMVNQAETILSDTIVLAIGHSARDTFWMLYENKVPMEAKSFAVGFRVEHMQKTIDAVQYGSENVGKLPAAPYKVTAQTSNGRGVYSFCMCPGGFVVNASSEKGRIAVNGMSYSKRDSQNANSAIIVSVTPADYPSDHPLSGLAFQRNLEEKAFTLGKGAIPVQFFGDYENNTTQMETQLEKENISIKGKYSYANLRQLLPEECEQAFVEGMHHFEKSIHGFADQKALLSGVESRTSSPVRIHRNEALQCISIAGLYPCGEGAGYAGGITSAAMDGCRVAEEIVKRYHEMYEKEQVPSRQAL